MKPAMSLRSLERFSSWLRRQLALPPPRRLRCFQKPATRWNRQSSASSACVLHLACCRRAGQKVRVIDVKPTEAGPLGGWPEAEALFKCE